MLRTRVITALVLAPSIIAAIYLLETTWLGVLLALFTGAAAWEWAGLARFSAPGLRWVYVAMTLLITIGLHSFNLAATVLWILAGVWVIATLAVARWPGSGVWIAHPATVAILGLLILPGVWLALLTVHRLPNGPHWMLFGLLVCWAADIGAYFAGKAFGRHKLAVQVSPGKTWEGALGGLLLAVGACGGILWAAGAFQPVWLVVIATLVAISIIGDLFESLLKRATGTKDSGSLLPGHGGVLDRIDSVLAVAPFFALWMLHHAG